MKNHRNFKLLAIAAVISLILSLPFTSIAIADDAVPPATEEPNPPPVTEPIATAEPVVQDIPTTLPDVPELDQLPVDTTVIAVADEQPEPLPTQVAANVFVGGDPIWCPDTETNIGGGTCSGSYANLLLLINDINTIAPASNGTIWIMGDDASLSEVVIDDTTFAGWSNYSLTLQGGWTGSSTIGSNISGVSVFSAPISIESWNAPVTLNQITVNGLSYATPSTGLVIETSGNVSLNNVSSINNDNFGLVVEAGGDINAQDLTASNNGSGAELSSMGSITLADVSVFEDNLATGIFAEAVGDIYIENITASDNGAGGASGGGADLNSSTGSVFLVGTNTFIGNYETGLLVDAGGDIDLENITASYNAVGADLNSSGGLSITGINVFNNNDENGLYADVTGDINAENVTADANGLIGYSYGAGYGAELYTQGDFYLTGINGFNYNHSTGLYVDAVGDIEAENVTASNNLAGGRGAEFITLGGFTLSGTNVFNNNDSYGLVVDAGGSVSIQNVTALSNVGPGVFITGDGNAFITCGLTDNNGWAEIETDLNGFLTLAGVNFGNNIGDNLDVDEDLLVLISNSCFTYPQFFDDEEGDDDEEWGDGAEKFEINYAESDLLPINVVNADNGQVVKLECDAYRGTQVNILRGEAYIPCPIAHSARLLTIPESALPGALPNGMKVISSLHLDIDGVAYKPLDTPGSVEYADLSVKAKNFDTQVLHWNGQDWVNVTDQSNPFISIFFPISKEIKDKNLAVLYWDGTGWIELSDRQYLNDGRLVQAGGFIGNGFFEAIVNFTGTFVLVEK